MVKFEKVKQGEPMVYPYTLGAKFSQFPYRLVLNRTWFLRYWIYSLIGTMPLWIYINQKVNSPEAVAAWEAKKREDNRKEHLAHMWDELDQPNQI